MIAMLVMEGAIAERAALLRADFRLPDAVYLAAAIQAGCVYFISGDRKPVGAAGDRIQILDTHELTVRG